MTSPLTASVVIPAYNCQTTIEGTLHAVLNQKPTQPIDVTVVDDGSTDDTPNVVKSFPGVNYLRQDNAGPASARNAGASAARGDVIFFTDSDCVPHEDWIALGLLHFRDGTIGAVAGSYGIANPHSLLARCVHQEILFRHRVLMPEYPKSFGSYNVAVRKSLFQKVGGFNTGYSQASGEDNDLSYKILKAGSRIYFDREMKVDHHHPEFLLKYMKEQFRHGFWRARLYKDHPEKLTGDDYTFWKDAVEVPAVVLVMAAGLISIAWGGVATAVFLSANIFLLIVEFYFSFIIQKNIIEKIFFTFVMFGRAFARTFGFSTGLTRIFKNIEPKKAIIELKGP